jgi:hypothetical protein
VLAEPLLTRDDDAPPPSGVRVVVLESGFSGASRSYAGPRPVRDDVLLEVTEEVFFEVWSVVRALAPLQTAWFRIGLTPLAAAGLEVSTWSSGTSKELRRRWHELVPGVAALDRLAHLMVDALCA